MASELKVVTWIWERISELEWYQSPHGGFFAVINGVLIHTSEAGLLLARGPKQCKIPRPQESRKIMDAVDEMLKARREMMIEIHRAASQQVIRQVEDPKAHNDRMRRELFRELSGEIF